MSKPTFSLSEDQYFKLNLWQEKIFKKEGKYGNFSYHFTPTGIGMNVQVTSTLTNETIDISDYDKW